jgi:hypothetical protein
MIKFSLQTTISEIISKFAPSSVCAEQDHQLNYCRTSYSMPSSSQPIEVI